MTRDNAHLYLPLIKALSEGHTLQHLSTIKPGGDEWSDLEEVVFVKTPECYRVKPAPVKPVECWVILTSEGQPWQAGLWRSRGQAAYHMTNMGIDGRVVRMTETKEQL